MGCGAHVKFVASINTVIYGIPYAQGSEIDLTGWSRKQMLQFLALGLITSSVGGSELTAAITFTGPGVTTTTDSAGHVTVHVAQTLDILDDVDLTTTPPEDGQVLRYSSLLRKWGPG